MEMADVNGHIWQLLSIHYVLGNVSNTQHAFPPLSLKTAGPGDWRVMIFHIISSLIIMTALQISYIKFISEKKG